jgi:hypothetical protein
MKYRIRIITFKSGRKIFIPQKKLSLGWFCIDYDGKVDVLYRDECNTRCDALDRIDKNITGNTSVHSIEFEYITRTL